MVLDLVLEDIPVAPQYHVYFHEDNSWQQPILCGILNLFVRSSFLVLLKTNMPEVSDEHVNQVMSCHNAIQHRWNKSVKNNGDDGNNARDNDAPLLSLIINFTVIDEKEAIQIWSSETRTTTVLFVGRTD